MSLCFDKHYKFTLLDEIGTVPVMYFPGISTSEGGHDGILVQIVPANGELWVGCFEFGPSLVNSVTGVYTTPDPDRLAIASRGAGYLVSSSSPSRWEKVEVFPVLGVYPVPQHDVLIFKDYTRLVAYGSEGVRWRTERLAYDDFDVVDVTDLYLHCELWSLRSEKKVGFTVEIVTGKVHGNDEIV